MKSVSLRFSGFALPGAALAAACLFVPACEIKEPCDAGSTMEYGLCIPPSDDIDGDGGAGGNDGGPGGASSLEDANFDADCTEGGDECTGGTVCGAPDLPRCVGLCGSGDPFEDNCPSGKSCTDFGRAIVCF